jgi:chitinase
MPREGSFWRSFAVIGFAHLVVLVVLVRWSGAAKKPARQEIVWMNSGGGGETQTAVIPVVAPFVPPTPPPSEPEAEPEPTPAPQEKDENFAATKTDIPLTTPTPAATATPKPTPVAKATPKPSPMKKAIAKSSPTPKPKAAVASA